MLSVLLIGKAVLNPFSLSPAVLSIAPGNAICTDDIAIDVFSFENEGRDAIGRCLSQMDTVFQTGRAGKGRIWSYSRGGMEYTGMA